VRLVVALGGNALLRRGERPGAEVQRANVRVAARAVAELAREYAVVLTHGNGPQVGLLALHSADPLDVLGAESEGMIGYLIEQEIANALPGREVATLLTQVEIDPRDPAFGAPTKPIGPVYPEAEARALATTRGWAVGPDGAGFRRLVPSPEPLRIRELRTIELLVEADVIVVCAGGGGIPVAVAPGGSVHGVEAVIDKDLSAALLARELRADALLLLTDVPALYLDWPEPARRPLASARPAELRALRFESGSMAPKVEAACRFVEATGGLAAIGALADAGRILRGEAGTRVFDASRGGL
jgi:carbamate kinase